MKSKSLLIAGALSLGVITPASSSDPGSHHGLDRLSHRRLRRPSLPRSMPSPAVSIAAYNANGALDPHSASFMTFDGNIGGAH